MSFQKCPKCDGSGKDLHSHIVSDFSPACFICNGFGIINEQTGQPAYKIVTSTSITLDSGDKSDDES